MAMDNQNIDNKVRGPSIRLSTVATSTRQTPKTDFGTVMRDGLIKAGNVAVDGLKVAAPFIPGSAIVSAAVAGANLAATVQGPSYGGSAGLGGTAGGGMGMSAGGGGGISGGIGSSVSGLTSGGGGPVAGNYGASGQLAIPGRGPTTTTSLNQSPSSFSGGSLGTGGATSSGTSDAFNQMMSATQNMAEFQASFNLQYLQLQEKIQQDSRQFNLVSNIMKTKHDAAKNALNNVR
jgi:hypothetical protein